MQSAHEEQPSMQIVPHGEGKRNSHAGWKSYQKDLENQDIHTEVRHSNPISL